MIRTDPEANLAKAGIGLPPPSKPVAAYIPVQVAGDLVYVSGQIPMRDGALIAKGRVPSQVSLEAAQECARQCVLNGLAAVKARCGNLNRVKSVVRIGVFVACDVDFVDHPKVANGASELLHKAFGDQGLHARAAVGAPSLPLGAPVEVEMLLELWGRREIDPSA
jgi:enamine deaminase RidA (YjgF/YER057c/UK114 family)